MAINLSQTAKHRGAVRVGAGGWLSGGGERPNQPVSTTRTPNLIETSKESRREPQRATATATATRNLLKTTSATQLGSKTSLWQLVGGQGPLSGCSGGLRAVCAVAARPTARDRLHPRRTSLHWAKREYQLMPAENQQQHSKWALSVAITTTFTIILRPLKIKSVIYGTKARRTETPKQRQNTMPNSERERESLEIERGR